jgi:hypothetical protein
MTKTEACWDRTEGCCMTEAFERKRGRREGPQVIFFGGDDAREEWTWECRFPHQRETQTFNDAPTWAEAAAQLAKHHQRHHGARGRHGCPRCGAPVCNRTEDPERTDLCPPCTVEVFAGGALAEVERLRAVQAEDYAGIERITVQRDQIRALVTATGPDLSCAGHSIGHDGCFAAGLAERVLAVLDETNESETRP